MKNSTLLLLAGLGVGLLYLTRNGNTTPGLLPDTAEGSALKVTKISPVQSSAPAAPASSSSSGVRPPSPASFVRTEPAPAPGVPYRAQPLVDAGFVRAVPPEPTFVMQPSALTKTPVSFVVQPSALPLPTVPARAPVAPVQVVTSARPRPLENTGFVRAVAPSPTLIVRKQLVPFRPSIAVKTLVPR